MFLATGYQHNQSFPYEIFIIMIGYYETTKQKMCPSRSFYNMNNRIFCSLEFSTTSTTQRRRTEEE